MHFTFHACLFAVALVVSADVCAAELPTDSRSFASAVRPNLPKGWTLETRGDQVTIERTKPVEVYNGIGLPGFESETELRRYVAPRVCKKRFVISLRFGDHVAPEVVATHILKNREAVEEARKDARDGKLMPTRQFWQNHPEYGYKELPSFDTGRHSVYMDASPYGAPWAFWSTAVQQECDAVLSIIKKQFRAR